MNDSSVPPNVCGIVMPISSIDGCSEHHWTDVQLILREAIESAGFQPNLVSNADEVGIIHKVIIQNLYDNPVVVCDVSGKNPNVMFELGLRLAFDKPTIIIKDDQTAYSFDTSAIEHLEYPRDLRFTKIIEFKKKLSAKIKATHEISCTDANYTTFLKHFGEFKVAKLDEKEVSGQEYILEELKSLRNTVLRIERTSWMRNFRNSSPRIPHDIETDYGMFTADFCLNGLTKEQFSAAIDAVKVHSSVFAVKTLDRGNDHRHLVVSTVPGFTNPNELEALLASAIGPNEFRKLSKNCE